MKRAIHNDTEPAMRALSAALIRTRSNREVYDCLFAILTPRERKAIGLRWRLVTMLAEGMTQRAIANRLGISLCKITRGARELKTGPLGFRRAVARACHHAVALNRARSVPRAGKVPAHV